MPPYDLCCSGQSAEHLCHGGVPADEIRPHRPPACPPLPFTSVSDRPSRPRPPAIPPPSRGRRWPHGRTSCPGPLRASASPPEGCSPRRRGAAPGRACPTPGSSPGRRYTGGSAPLVVDVPIVPAGGFKGHVGDGDAALTAQRAKVAGSAEIPARHRIGAALRKEILKRLAHMLHPLTSARPRRARSPHTSSASRGCCGSSASAGPWRRSAPSPPR